MVYTSRLSSKGQVTIPSEVRESLRLAAGDLVGYEVRAEEVVLKRIEPFDAAFHAALSATLDEWSSPEDEEAFRDL
jgi:antitoxin PrlF